jgi:hypothetical protein
MKNLLPLCLKFMLFLSIVVFHNIGQAQDKVTFPHSVFWSKTEVNEIFKNGFGVGADFVYRRKNELGQGSMFDARLRESFRPWVHYQFSPYARFSFSPIGYMYTHEYVSNEEDLDRAPYHELRTTFQFFHHHKQLKGKLMHTWRYRYEMRWQEISGSSDYRYFNRFRFRYRIRYVINGNDFYANNTFYLAVSDEIGLNFGKNVYLNTFNQNRLYIGAGMRFFNGARVELRYVNRIRTRGATGYEFDNGQGFMIGIYIDQISVLGLGKKDAQPVRFVD